ncbi:MAG: ribosome biogenesis GTPase Der [Chloroflexi bacterium]|nr:ribosome biogenesis GTPase Der [Chloroflexota bacterium]
MRGSVPLVAIVGRPQVGKSTLFNRLIGKRQAIVGEEPGTTRDRLYADAVWDGVEFTLVDTGGLVPWAEEELLVEVGRQVATALAEAEAILFVVDASQGLVGADEEIADRLRRTAKPVLLAANKIEGKGRRPAAAEFYRLGVGTPHPISALHGTGTGDLLDALVAALPKMEALTPTEPGSGEAPRVAIVGRPNVGKSSLLNTILGQERAIVSKVPGTTRDALDTPLTWRKERVILIDTAGIRRRGRMGSAVEHYSVLRALRAIQRSDVVLLLLDAAEGTAAQDAHIGGYVVDEGRGLVLVVNKWDLVPHPMRAQARAEYEAKIGRLFRFAPYAPLSFVSALKGQGTGELLDVALKVQKERRRQVPADQLNQWLRDVVAQHAPPSAAGRPLRFYAVAQTGIDPPTFAFSVSDPQTIHFSYQRYLENALRQAFGFPGTPLRLVYRRDRKTSRRLAS